MAPIQSRHPARLRLIDTFLEFARRTTGLCGASTYTLYETHLPDRELVERKREILEATSPPVLGHLRSDTQLCPSYIKPEIIQVHLRNVRINVVEKSVWCESANGRKPYCNRHPLVAPKPLKKLKRDSGPLTRPGSRLKNWWSSSHRIQSRPLLFSRIAVPLYSSENVSVYTTSNPPMPRNSDESM